MPSMKYGSAPKEMLDSFTEDIGIFLQQDDGPAIIDVTVHAHIFGRPRGAYYLEKIVEQAVSMKEVWIATRSEIAAHVLARTSK